MDTCPGKNETGETSRPRWLAGFIALGLAHCVHAFDSADTLFTRFESPMLKVILVPRRHPQMTRSQFFDHLANHHAALVRSVDEFVRFVRGYVQNHTRLPSEGADYATPCRRAVDRDSVIEVWFDDPDGLHRALAEPRYQALIRPDEARFNDLSSLIVLATREMDGMRTDAAPSAFKLFDVLKRRSDISRDQFVMRWQRHVELLRRHDAYCRCVRRSVLNVVVPDEANPFGQPADFDGVMEIWLGSFADAAAIAALQVGDAELVESLRSFVDPADSFSVLALEHPVIDPPDRANA